jgi:serine/threonine protein kinase
VIHGDLTGTNVLIDLNGKAYIADFGLSAIKAEFENTPSSYWPSTVGGAIRWRAPELLPAPSNDYVPVLSSPCDVYSFGSLTLQVRDLSRCETFLA